MTSKELLDPFDEDDHLLQHRLTHAIRDQSVRAISIWIGVACAVSGGLGLLASRSTIWQEIEATTVWWVSASAATVVFAGSVFVKIFINSRTRNADETTDIEALNLKYRIDMVNAAFADAVRLMDQLQDDLDKRSAQRDRVLEDVGLYTAWLESKRPEVERYKKAQSELDDERNRAASRENRIYFIVGIVSSIPIGIVINLLTG